MKDERSDRVRIDAQGQVHPTGTQASRRLRAQAGVYRLLPAPEYLVLMRRDVEPEASAEQGATQLRLAGEINAPGALFDILGLIAQLRFRGEIQVLDPAHSRSIFVDGPNVVGATTTLEEERLASVMYRYGALTEIQKAEVVRLSASGRRIGEVVLELGLLREEQLYAHISHQIREIVFGALSVAEGTFFLLNGFAERRLVSRHTLGLSNLLMEAVTRMDELPYFRQRIPSAAYVPSRTGRLSSYPAELAPVYDKIDGQRNVAELGRLTGLGEFETTKALYALLQSQHIALGLPRISGGPLAVVDAANRALRAIFRAAERADMLLELQQSLSAFAVGAGVYDILFRSAGPDASGALHGESIVHNARLVSGAESSEALLQQLLHEYVSFALFSLGTQLGAGAEAELTQALAPSLSALRPSG